MNLDRPNHVHYHDGSTHFGDTFGGLHSVTPVSLTGNGHNAHIEVRTLFGLRLDLTPGFFAALLRDGPAALAKLPMVPACDDAVGGDA